MPLRLALSPYLENSALVSILLLRQILEIFFFFVYTVYFSYYFSFFLNNSTQKVTPFFLLSKHDQKRNELLVSVT